MKPQQEQELRAQVEQVRSKLEGLAADVRVVDDEVESLATQRMQHDLLEQACGSLEKLGELGAASLFWGERIESGQIEEQLCSARSRVSNFKAQLGELDERRQTILAGIDLEKENFELLDEDLYQIREAEERRKLEWIVDRDISPVPPRVQRMAWARGDEDDKRFYKSLAASLLISLFLGALLPLIDLPLPKRFVPDELPKRLAQLVRREQAKLITPPPVVAETQPEQTPPEQQEPVEESKPIEDPETPAIASAESQPRNDEPIPADQPGLPGDTTAPQQTVRKAGILAFRDKFASLAKDKVDPRLGADARYGNADDVSRGSLPTRSMLTTNAPGSSGGINIGSLSRNVGGGNGSGGGGGGGIQGVPLGRATSTIASIG